MSLFPEILISCLRNPSVLIQAILLSSFTPFICLVFRHSLFLSWFRALSIILGVDIQIFRPQSNIPGKFCRTLRHEKTVFVHACTCLFCVPVCVPLSLFTLMFACVCVPLYVVSQRVCVAVCMYVFASVSLSHFYTSFESRVFDFWILCPKISLPPDFLA